ncbi:MAG: aromatic ring-opening dioxygenase subunit LigA [Woeseiaceae bacterium]|nr:aromatic ring-opening dioxygenase subunit LigA [Woeseiaceae bacterium]
MSLYNLQKFLYELNRDEAFQQKCREDIAGCLEGYELTDEEAAAIKDGDIGLLYVLGVNGQILMHYAAFLGIEWFDYLDLMRKGIEKHGPVRAGVYAMTGGGDAFTVEDPKR